jgi:ADP-heptose:LPS heptosyltransferase
VTVLEQLPGGARVLILRLRSLGDCVLTTPALAILRRSRPDLRVGVVVESRFAAVFEDSSDIEEILEPKPRAVAGFGAVLCLNLHGGTRSQALAMMSRARLRAGFAHFRNACIYNVPIPRAQEILNVNRKVHTAEHLASAMFYLGVPVCEIPRARLAAAAPPLARPYAVLHPTASQADKTWPAERFLEVAEHLENRLDLEPVFIAGPGEDLGAFARRRSMVGAPLKDVMGLIAGASLFVGNDSGPAHLAAGFGVPVVVLYGSSDPVVWAPWRTQSEVVIAPSAIADVPARTVMDALERLRVKA